MILCGLKSERVYFRSIAILIECKLNRVNRNELNAISCQIPVITDFVLYTELFEWIIKIKFQPNWCVREF